MAFSSQAGDKLLLPIMPNIYFFFAINWFANACYDLFPIWGWMEPLNHTEYGVHNLMGTLFIIVFFTQMLFGNSYLLKVFQVYDISHKPSPYHERNCQLPPEQS